MSDRDNNEALPKSMYAGVTYWLIFFILIFWALNHDLTRSATMVKESGHIQGNTSVGDSTLARKTIWERTTEDPVAFFTFWLSVFTCVLAVSTIGLWIVTWRSAKRQSEDMRRFIEIATKSVKLTERTFTDIERALVTVSRINASRIYFGDKVVAYAIEILLQNTGRTIAIGARDIAQIAEGLMVGIFYGWAEYDDVFNRSSRHRIEFCFRLELSGTANVIRHPVSLEQVAVPFRYAPFGAYNGMDEDCVYQPGTTPVAEPGELLRLTPVTTTTTNISAE